MGRIDHGVPQMLPGDISDLCMRLNIQQADAEKVWEAVHFKGLSEEEAVKAVGAAWAPRPGYMGVDEDLRRRYNSEQREVALMNRHRTALHDEICTLVEQAVERFAMRLQAEDGRHVSKDDRESIVAAYVGR